MDNPNKLDYQAIVLNAVRIASGIPGATMFNAVRFATDEIRERMLLSNGDHSAMMALLNSDNLTSGEVAILGKILDKFEVA